MHDQLVSTPFLKLNHAGHNRVSSGRRKDRDSPLSGLLSPLPGINVGNNNRSQAPRHSIFGMFCLSQFLVFFFTCIY